MKTKRRKESRDKESMALAKLFGISITSKTGISYFIITLRICLILFCYKNQWQGQES
jgi:hypothetical protein